MKSQSKDMMTRQKIINYWHRWLGPSLASGVLKMASMAAIFLIMLLLGRVGGAETLGLFALGLTLLQLIVLCAGFGLPSYLMRQVAWSRSHKVTEYNIGSDYYTSFLLVFLFGLAISIFWFVGSGFLSEKVFHKVLLTDVMQWAGLAVLPYSLLVLHADALSGMGHPVLGQALRNVAIPVLAVCWVFLALCFGDNHISASLTMTGYTCSSWLVGLAGIIIWHVLSKKELVCFFDLRNSPFFFLKKAGRDFGQVKLVLRKGGVFLVAGVAMTVLGMTDTLMLGILSSASAVGSYNAAYRFATSLGIILISVNNILAPRLGHSYSARDMDGFSKQVKTGISLTFWPTLLAGGILLAFSSQFLSLFGSEFEKAALVMQILVVGALANALCGPVGWVLCMTGHEATFQRILLASAGLNIILNAILIPLYGAVGAAITTTVCTALWNFLSAVFASKHLGVCTIYGCNRFLERRING